MKKITLSLVFVTAGLIPALAQISAQDAISYSMPMQIDSSDSYIMGTLIDRTNKMKYNFGGSFRGFSNWTNVLIYNSKTHESKKVFTTSPVLVLPVSNFIYGPINYPGMQEYRSGIILKNHIVFLAKTDEINKNGVIDEDDPVSFFISSKSGNNLTQISPKDVNVISWTLSKDGKTILVKLQKDKNGDNKFGGEDEQIYQLELNDDISKIKIVPAII